MTYPLVTEKPAALKAVTHDTFIDDLRTRPSTPVPFSGPAITPPASRR